MRVLHVIPAVAPRYGGPSRAIVSMCQALLESGVRPFIATTDADGRGRLPVSLGAPTTWQGIPAVFFKKDFSEAFKYSRGLSSWLRHHVCDFDAVHIHAVLSHAPLAAAAACDRMRIPYVVRPLGTIAPWSLGQNAFRKRVLLVLAGMRMLRRAAAIHYTSDEEQREAECALRLSRGVVIPLGADPSFSTGPLPVRGADPYVLVLSRLHSKKNLEALIGAFIDISACDGDERWRLVIAGAGEEDYEAALKRLVHARGGGDRVSFVGWVDGAVKHELLRKASLFALPSLQENFGISLVEALASGVPALVSRQVNLSDAVERARAGWVVDSDASSLRAGLVDALASAHEREVRGQAARELARQFSWPAVAVQLAELYRRIASPSQCGSSSARLAS